MIDFDCIASLSVVGSGKDKGPESLSVVQSRKNLMRAHIVALVLDAEKVLTFILICRANDLWLSK